MVRSFRSSTRSAFYLFYAPFAIRGYRGNDFDEMCLLIDKNAYRNRKWNEAVETYANSVGQFVLIVSIFMLMCHLVHLYLHLSSKRS